MTVDPLVLVYAGIEAYKAYSDNARFNADMEALKVKNLDAAGILEALHTMRSQAAAEARAAVEKMQWHQ